MPQIQPSPADQRTPNARTNTRPLPRSLTAALAVLTLTTSLCSCARDIDGRRMSFSETWREWAARQDQAARAAVDTSE